MPGTANAKCPIFFGNFTPKTSNYCLKNRALGFPGGDELSVPKIFRYQVSGFILIKPLVSGELVSWEGS